jgi:hypothetical protein
MYGYLYRNARRYGGNAGGGGVVYRAHAIKRGYQINFLTLISMAC